MTAIQLEAARIPNLGRLWFWMVLIALVGHLGAAFYIFKVQPETSSGGGGKVLGTLSIALGGSAADVPEVNDERPPVDVKHTPQVEPAKAEAPVAPQPRKARPQPKNQTKPVTRPAPPATSEVQPVRPVKSQAAPQKTQPSTPPASASPASIPSNATPTLGEGAAAAKPGVGGAVDTSTADYDAYLAMLRARIEANRTYPSSARRSGHEGIASIRLVIGSNGHLTQVSIVKSSGHFTLDRAAKRMAQKAQPFPAPPQSTFDVTVPVVFALH